MSFTDVIKTQWRHGDRLIMVAATMAMFAVILVTVALLVNLIRANEPFEPLRVGSDFPRVDNSPVVAGSQVSVTGEKCNDSDVLVFGYRTVFLVPEADAARIQISSLVRQWIQGCETLQNTYTVPAITPPGKYYVAGTDTAVGPDGRNQTITWITEPFEVISARP